METSPKRQHLSQDLKDEYFEWASQRDKADEEKGIDIQVKETEGSKRNFSLVFWQMQRVPWLQDRKRWGEFGTAREWPVYNAEQPDIDSEEIGEPVKGLSIKWHQFNPLF